MISKLQSCSSSFPSFGSTDLNLDFANSFGIHLDGDYQDIEVDQERYVIGVADKMNPYVPLGGNGIAVVSISKAPLPGSFELVDHMTFDVIWRF